MVNLQLQKIGASLETEQVISKTMLIQQHGGVKTTLC